MILIEPGKPIARPPWSYSMHSGWTETASYRSSKQSNEDASTGMSLSSSHDLNRHRKGQLIPPNWLAFFFDVSCQYMLRSTDIRPTSTDTMLQKFRCCRNDQHANRPSIV